MVKRRSILLAPLSLVYGAITRLRNLLYDLAILPSREFSVPVICRGNITAGGTGKTPHTEYIAGFLSEKFRTAVLSRGYKRKTRDFRLASPSSTVSEIGDEPLQISRKLPHIKVAVDRNRVQGVEKLLELDNDIQAILLDDGYQHRRIKPGLSILLMEYSRLITRDSLLPWGNLRESAAGMKRADIILVTKTPPGLSAIERRITVKEMNKFHGQNLYFTSIEYREPRRVFQPPAQDPESNSVELIPESSVLLLTGIANPGPLREHLGNKFREVVHMPFPDHRNFTANDLESVFRRFDAIGPAPKYIITTEKDAVRIIEFTNIAEPYRSAFIYIPIGIGFLNDDRDEFEKLVIDYVGKNK
jgi:tetraacyldisaccharide 4'-kinase